MIKKLLVGYDGSVESANALNFALNMAKTYIIGHRAKSQWTRWIVGSITECILDHAQCNVIVVKQDHHSKRKGAI